MATPIEPVPDAVLPPPPPPPVVEAAALPKSEDLLVSGLEQIKGYEAFGKFDGQMYAGLLPMDNGNRTGKIMFWLFEPAQQTFDNSMVMWLNGGPGCSSFNCGVLMEICTFLFIHQLMRALIRLNSFLLSFQFSLTHIAPLYIHMCSTSDATTIPSRSLLFGFDP